MAKRFNTITCSYHNECPAYDFFKCARYHHMQNCEQLNKYLQNSMKEREVQDDHNTDMGLVKRLREHKK